MLISQYAHFGLRSLNTSAAEMTAALGIEPDEFSVRGSRYGGPKPRPALHRWKIVCREPGMSVDEQVARIVQRLAKHVEAIAALVTRLEAEDGEYGGAGLEIVRKYNHPDGQDRRAGTYPDGIDPSDLLGWYLDRNVLDFLHATRAWLDVDEYDFTPDPDDD